MIVSFYDKNKEKVAEFYETKSPTIFLRGALEVARENESDIQMTIICRQEMEITNDRYDQ